MSITVMTWGSFPLLPSLPVSWLHLYLHTPPPPTHIALQSNGIKVIWSDTLCNSVSSPSLFFFFLLSVSLSFPFFLYYCPPDMHACFSSHAHGGKDTAGSYEGTHWRPRQTHTLMICSPHTYMAVCIQYWIVLWGSLGLLVGRTRGCRAALSAYLTEWRQRKSVSAMLIK